MGSFNLIRGKTVRVTKLDACGNRVLSPFSSVITDGYVSFQMTAQTNQGNPITVTNAAGKDCVSDTPAPEFTGYQVQMALCGVNPELLTLMTGQAIYYDTDGTTVLGIEESTDVDLDTFAWAIELWSSVPSGSCVGGSPTYGYFLLPFIGGGVMTDVTIQNDAITFGIQNALTKDGNAWGVGPYNVISESGSPSPLPTALGVNTHRLAIKTTVAPPTAADGFTALGVPATGAVAGIPGHYTPTNSYAPANLAGLSTVTASPSTAWTTGQYILLRDGSKAHWTSTAWAANAA